jgi:hypothetical protein
MLVKVGKKFFDSHDIPIMIILTDEEKELIANMTPSASKFCSYPDNGYTPEEIKEFMRGDSDV